MSRRAVFLLIPSVLQDASSLLPKVFTGKQQRGGRPRPRSRSATHARARPWLPNCRTPERAQFNSVRRPQAKSKPRRSRQTRRADRLPTRPPEFIVRPEGASYVSHPDAMAWLHRTRETSGHLSTAAHAVCVYRSRRGSPSRDGSRACARLTCVARCLLACLDAPVVP